MSAPRTFKNIEKCNGIKHSIIFVLFDSEGKLYKAYEKASSATSMCVKINGRVEYVTLNHYTKRGKQNGN